MHDHATNRDAERTSHLTEASRDQSANRQLGATNRETRRLGQRHTVKEAAEVLGTSVDAVRGRLRRGTLDSVKLDGVVYVLLDATDHEQHSDKSETETDDARKLTADQSELVGELRGQIDWLRREVERKDTIIMSLTQRIPELETSKEPPYTAEVVSEAAESRPGTEGRQTGTEERRPSWWRRFFGFE